MESTKADNNCYQKRSRTSFTVDQLEELESAFKKNKYIKHPERYHLAKRLELTEQVIKVWFQNRRIKDKLQEQQQSQSQQLEQQQPQTQEQQQSLPQDQQQSLITQPEHPQWLAYYPQHQHQHWPMYDPHQHWPIYDPQHQHWLEHQLHQQLTAYQQQRLQCMTLCYDMLSKSMNSSQ